MWFGQSEVKVEVEGEGEGEGEGKGEVKSEGVREGSTVHSSVVQRRRVAVTL